MLSDMQLLHDAARTGPGGRSACTSLPILILLAVQLVTLTGCEDSEEMATGDGHDFGGCSTSELISLLQVNGQAGLTEKEVYGSGLALCGTPRGLDNRCMKPTQHIQTEIDIVCPFLFNIWDLPRDRKYGKGEQAKLKNTMEARCHYPSNSSDRPRWCFTSFCKDVPLNCFTSEKVAEESQPWETQKEGNSELQVRELDAPSATGSRQEHSLHSPDSAEASKASSDEQSPDSATPSLHDNHVARHQRKGARRTSLQVTQHAFTVVEHM